MQQLENINTIDNTKYYTIGIVVSIVISILIYLLQKSTTERIEEHINMKKLTLKAKEINQAQKIIIEKVQKIKDIKDTIIKVYEVCKEFKIVKALKNAIKTYSEIGIGGIISILITKIIKRK